MSNPARSQTDIDTGLMALIAWAGNAAAAVRSLKAEGKLDVSRETLQSWAREKHADRYQELRGKYADQMEAQLVGEFRDVARLAVDVQRQALEKAADRLRDNRDQDPSRTAANAATVADKNTREMLALSGRPTSITESRGVEEILRSLVGKGILHLPAADVEGTEPSVPAAIGALPSYAPVEGAESDKRHDRTA